MCCKIYVISRKILTIIQRSINCDQMNWGYGEGKCRGSKVIYLRTRGKYPRKYKLVYTYLFHTFRLGLRVENLIFTGSAGSWCRESIVNVKRFVGHIDHSGRKRQRQLRRLHRYITLLSYLLNTLMPTEPMGFVHFVINYDMYALSRLSVSRKVESLSADWFYSKVYSH